MTKAKNIRADGDGRHGFSLESNGVESSRVGSGIRMFLLVLLRKKSCGYLDYSSSFQGIEI
jgi:hypothetical protein